MEVGGIGRVFAKFRSFLKQYENDEKPLTIIEKQPMWWDKTYRYIKTLRGNPRSLGVELVLNLDIRANSSLTL